MPPAEVGREKGDDSKPGVAVPVPQVTNVHESIEQGMELDSPLSGRLRYPDNPEILESGRIVGEGY